MTDWGPYAWGGAGFRPALLREDQWGQQRHDPDDDEN